MTNIFSSMLVAFIFIFCTIAYAGTSKTIHFATEATYPPFEYTDASGQIKGFDIDIANALCHEMKVQCTFGSQSFNSLIPSLTLGKYDALIASLGITAEREKQVNFSHSYYQPSASFVGPLDKKYSINKLDGLTVGVQQGSTFENYLHDKFGTKISIKSYSNAQEAFLDLNSGRVDVVISDTPIAQAWLKQNSKQFGVIEKPIVDPQYFGIGYGIAVNKNNPELLNSFNQALVAIKRNGIYANIVKNYFNKN